MILARASDDRALMRALLPQFNVSVTDSVGRFLEVNENFCRMSRYSREALIGQPHSLLNSGTHEPAFWAAMWTAIAGGDPWCGDICDPAKDGCNETSLTDERRFMASMLNTLPDEVSFKGCDGRFLRATTSYPMMPCAAPRSTGRSSRAACRSSIRRNCNSGPIVRRAGTS